MDKYDIQFANPVRISTTTTLSVLYPVDAVDLEGWEHGVILRAGGEDYLIPWGNIKIIRTPSVVTPTPTKKGKK